MNLNVFQQATSLHQQGKLAEAKEIYNSLLIDNPDNYEALHFLGVIAVQMGQYSLAVDLMNKSIKLNPNISDTYSNLGVALNSLKLFEEAIINFDKAISISPALADAHFNKGLASLQLDKLNEAVESFNYVIKLRPQHIKAYFNLGVAFQQLNRYEDALIAYDKTIALKPDYFEAYFNRGHALHELHFYEECIASYSKSIELNPYFVDAYLNRGLALQMLKKPDDAISDFDSVISINPNKAQAYLNKGNALQEMQRFDEAILNYENAFLYEPKYVEAYSNMGSALEEIDRTDDAIKSFSKAVSIDPEFSVGYFNRGNSYLKLKNYPCAIDNFDIAIKLKTNYHEALCNKGLALYGLKKYEEALIFYEKALDLKHDYSAAWSNKGFALSGIKQYEDAIYCYKQAIKFDPENAEIQLNLAHSYLNLCMFKLGWNQYEWRWQTKKYKDLKLKTVKPLWQGDKKEGRLLVWAEQGIGDQIMYSSIFAELGNFPQQKIISLDNKLIPIYERSFSDLIFINNSHNLYDIDFDEHIPIASLGKYFRQSYRDFHNTVFPYLLDDKKKTKNFTLNYTNPKKITCGISWKSANSDIGDDKSIPLNQLESILKINQIDFISLQYENSSFKLTAQDKRYDSIIKNVDGIDIYNDIDSVLSIINSCDVIITCSNSTAHLAGALNKPTLLLIPFASGRFWYWSEFDGKSLWYPSVKIFNQTNPFNWIDSIERVKEYLLKEFVSNA